MGSKAFFSMREELSNAKYDIQNPKFYRGYCWALVNHKIISTQEHTELCNLITVIEKRKEIERHGM